MATNRRETNRDRVILRTVATINQMRAPREDWTRLAEEIVDELTYNEFTTVQPTTRLINQILRNDRLGWWLK